jgi:hypothetical protein
VTGATGATGAAGTPGTPGADGINGTNGFNAAIQMCDIPVLDLCKGAGGVLVVAGPDTSGKNLPDEKFSSSFAMCNATPAPVLVSNPFNPTAGRSYVCSDFAL